MFYRYYVSSVASPPGLECFFFGGSPQFRFWKGRSSCLRGPPPRALLLARQRATVIIVRERGDTAAEVPLAELVLLLFHRQDRNVFVCERVLEANQPLHWISTELARQGVSVSMHVQRQV